MGLLNLAKRSPGATGAGASSPLSYTAPSGLPERAGAPNATPLRISPRQRNRGLREAPTASEWRYAAHQRDASSDGADAPISSPQQSGPGGAPLDTLAQLRQNPAGPSGQTPEQTLQKRARAKYFSLPLGTALADLRRGRRVAAEVAGDFELAELHRQFEKSYRNTVYCAGRLEQKGGKLEGRYCSNRWCLVCARVKTGRAINRYAPTLQSWEGRWLVTLTAPNVSADQLRRELKDYLADAASIALSMRRTHGLSLVAVRKLECTYNEHRDDYHPHFHFVVRDEAAARLLVQLWLKWRPDANPNAQDVRPATDGDVRELFKYFTKLVTKAASNPAARGSVRVAQAEKLDVIFSAMRGLRVFQPTGFTLPKQNDEELPVGEDGHTSAPAHTRNRIGDFPDVAVWNWEQQSTDWFNPDTGEALAEYNPSAAMRKLVSGIELQRETHYIPPPEDDT